MLSNQDVRQALASAAIATAGTTCAAFFLGKSELGKPAAPMNAVSHILWGDAAAEQDLPDFRHTAAGLMLNAGAMIGWAAVQEAALGKWIRRGPLVRTVAAGAATSAIAYVVDYHVVPKRFTPGFEKRLSSRGLAIMYGILALSFAVGLAAGRSRDE